MFNWWNSSCCKFPQQITRSYNRLRIKFENHIKELYLKVCKKINALCHISSSMSLEKCRTLMKAFNYCPLIWILRSRRLNSKINHIHERAWRIVYSDYNSSFYELFDKDDNFTIHQKNVQNWNLEIPTWPISSNTKWSF